MSSNDCSSKSSLSHRPSMLNKGKYKTHILAGVRQYIMLDAKNSPRQKRNVYDQGLSIYYAKYYEELAQTKRNAYILAGVQSETVNILC